MDSYSKPNIVSHQKPELDIILPFLLLKEKKSREVDMGRTKYKLKYWSNTQIY